MKLWIILVTIWLVVGIAFTIIMGVKNYCGWCDWTDYVVFFILYGIFWPISLPLILISFLLKKVVDYLHNKFLP